MSDKQKKQTLLVDQDEALGFYFDALLSPDDNEDLSEESSEENEYQEEVNSESLDQVQQTTKEFSDSTEQQTIDEQKITEKSVDNLQSTQDFLEASRLRQQKQLEPQTPDILSSNLKEEKAAEVSKKVDTQHESGLGYKRKHEVITKGPVSPKPRVSEEQKTVKKPVEPAIVFAETDKDGKVTEQVLMPRSQRLAATQQSGQYDTVAKTVVSDATLKTSSITAPASGQNEPLSKSLQPEKSSQVETGSWSTNDAGEALNEVAKPPMYSRDDQKERVSHVAAESNLESMQSEARQTQAITETQNATAKEAPNVDLSLFLPKIKTLSEEEIAQQIEALTQAAVSQAQLESDLAQAAQIEQVKQRTLLNQAEPDSEALIRNTGNAPEWAVPNFQVLLFAVAGLKLAVPLTELNGIVEWGDEYITEMPGHASWYLGLIQNQGKNVPVIDTLQQVVPQNRWPENHLNERNFKHIILIDNGQWGLACEKVLEVITLDTESVKWRSSRTKRRWLLGTVIDHMCALLDSSEFAAMLKTGEDSLMNE